MPQISSAEAGGVPMSAEAESSSSRRPRPEAGASGSRSPSSSPSMVGQATFEGFVSMPFASTVRRWRRRWCKYGRWRSRPGKGQVRGLRPPLMLPNCASSDTRRRPRAVAHPVIWVQAIGHGGGAAVAGRRKTGPRTITEIRTGQTRRNAGRRSRQAALQHPAVKAVTGALGAEKLPDVRVQDEG